MEERSSFEGFPGAPRFLRDLEENNNREWFQAHKQEYLDAIVAPGRSYIELLGARLETVLPGVRYDTRTNGQGSFGRIYRDIRFSKDKRPYRTRAWFAFWHGPGKKTESPAFSLSFDTAGWRIIAGQHRVSKPVLEAYRKAVIDEEMGLELEEFMLRVEREGQYEIGERKYKRVPTGYDPDHPLARWLRFSEVWVQRHFSEPDILANPDIVDRSYDECAKLAPLVRWLVKVNDRARPHS